MKKQSKLLIGIIAAITVIVVVVIFIVITAVGGSKDTYDSHMKLAQRYLDELQYEQAIAEYNIAITIEPNNVEAYLALAEVYVSMEDYESAISVMESGIEQANSDELVSYLEEVMETYHADLMNADAPIEWVLPYNENVNNTVEFDDAISLNCPIDSWETLNEGTGSFAFEQTKETFAATPKFIANSSQLTIVTYAGINNGNSIYTDDSMTYRVELYEVIDEEDVLIDYYIGACDLVEGGITFSVNQSCMYCIIVRIIDCPNNTRVSGHGHINSISTE